MKNLTLKSIKLFSIAFIILLLPVALLAQQHKVVAKYENQKELTANTSITFTDGFSISAGTEFKAYIAAGAGAPVNTIINPYWNAIVSYTTRAPGIIDPSDPQNGVNQVNVDVQTLDHFGRVVETQSVKATPTFQDIIQLTKYDNSGKESRKYLPYAYPTDRKNLHAGAYTQEVNYFYTGSTKTPSIATNSYPESQIRYDNSPQNRILETSAPGADFYIGNGHTVRTNLLMGTNDVAKYTVAINATTGSRKLERAGNNAVYSGLDLVISSVKNENVTAENGTVYEIKNREGQVLVKRQVIKVAGVNQTYSTYYVYDNLGNLSFVLPPKAEPDANAAIAQTTLDHLCYQYRYDGQNRMIGKKVPGKGWDYIVYNKLNQPVMSQDSVQRMKSPQEWSIVKYDALGRTIISGIYTQAGTAGTNYQATMQTSVNGQTKEWETRTTTGNGYTNDTYPTTWATTLTIGYFDDYNFPGGNPYPYAGSDASSMTRGMATGTKTNVLGTSDMLWTVSYYDRDGKAIKSFKQHYKGGSLTGNYDEITNVYDFNGAVTSSTRSHKVSGTEQLKVLAEYTYDHRGRKLNTWQTMNTGTRTLLSSVRYDDLGQLYKKKLHSTNGTSFLDSVTYSYNERGWLARAQAQKLDVKLRYNSPVKGATAQYNGNISEFEYTGQYSGNKWFTYTYDDLNRLTLADYGAATATDELNELIAYDKMGNITSLKRGPSSSTAINYTYANSGMSNQLTSTSGPAIATGAFTYDANGNAVSDGIRNVSAINYNQLNLPAKVMRIFSSVPTEVAAYTYDASGTKLRSVQGSITREYISGIQYTAGALDFVATEEGRAVRNPSTGAYRYEYNLKDNLGNVRVTIDDNSGVERVIQEDEFFAFGLDSLRHTSGTKNNYLYNGKELQEVLTKEYDYGARFYDPIIGRWHVVDPLVELGQESASPYNYVYDNPIKYTDPDGRVPDITITGENNSSVTVKTDLVEIKIDASPLGVDFGGNHTFNGDAILGAVLDIGGIFDQSGILDGIGAINSARQGNYGDALISGISAIPAIGDFAKVGKLKKDINIISDAINTAKAEAKVEKSIVKSAEVGSQKLSKVEKSKTVENIGDKFTKKTEVRPGKGPGQSRAEYTTYKNKAGKTVKTHKDSYDRGNKYQGRKPLRGGPEGREQ
ncbi:MAG: DUF6443 domain-containing protein [Bacteroidota bacterium]